MLDISTKPVHFFLDFNAVIVNLSSLSPDQQKRCLTDIGSNVKILKSYIEENLTIKENNLDIPKEGIAVLEQQLVLRMRLRHGSPHWKKTLGFNKNK